MIIRNLTSELQPIKIEELVGGRELTLYVEGHGVTDITGAYIPHIENYLGIFEIEDNVSALFARSTENAENREALDNHEDNIEEDEHEEENKEDIKSKEPEVIEDKFICDICKAEFASARGLNSHKNRVHSGE